MPSAAGLKTAVGISVAHNLIHDGPRDAVLVSGQDNVFEFNQITRCGFGSDDLGSFYSWLDWTIRGIVIRYNLMYDTVGGVNPDDAASGSLIFGNIFAGPRTGVWIASGPDHVIDNNIFVKLEGPVIGVDDRGESRGYATNSRLRQAVLAINPKSPPWSTRFPEITSVLENRPGLPLRTTARRNLVYVQKGDPYHLRMSSKNKQDQSLFQWADNLVTSADPGFVSATNGNYALKPDSDVYRKIPGFQPIPVDKIGLYRDEFRRSLPAPEEIGWRSPERMFRETREKQFGTL
jgi:hypothetical protein